ncbi:MAG TPA: hypothetical protein VLG76_07225 [Rhabdochlamydiaceae bacterium]|nr:hypothetical protein [Rhabdochlamydiaceae bacterium]
MHTRVSRLTVDLPSPIHKKWKALASLMDLSMKDLVLMSVEEFLQKKPNKVTEKALKQSMSGKNLKKFKNLDELFKDLGV